MAQYTPETRAEVHRLFKLHGHSGDLLVVDDQDDEAIFVVPVTAAAAIASRELATTLQAVLRRKVWIVDDAPVWVRQAHPFT